jgi:hypothetical protein
MGGSCLLDGPERALETRPFDAFGILSPEVGTSYKWSLIERSGLQDLNDRRNSED